MRAPSDARAVRLGEGEGACGGGYQNPTRNTTIGESHILQLSKTLYYLIMGQIVRHDEDHTDNCSREKSGLIS